MKPIIFFIFIILGYFIYGFYLSQVDFNVVGSNLKRENPANYYDYKGVLNVRSSLSDGLSTMDQIINDAKQTEMDFLIFTDINQFQKTTNAANYSGSLLVLNQNEYSFLDSRILVLSPSGDLLPQNSGEAKVFLTDLLSQQSTANRLTTNILAHPFIKDDPTWSGDYPPGLDGVEVINPKSVSTRAWAKSKVSVLWSFFVYPFSPTYAFLRLFSEPSNEINLWNQLSAKKQTIGFAGSDASARALPLANYLVKFPTYETTFQFVSNHVLLSSELTGQPSEDEQKLLAAIHQGHLYFSLDMLGNPKGFTALLKDKSSTYLMGSKVKFSKNLVISAHLPIKPNCFFEFVVYKNGELEKTENSTHLNYTVTSPGVYRVSVRVIPTLPAPDGKKWFTWIYTNPFYIY